MMRMAGKFIDDGEGCSNGCWSSLFVNKDSGKHKDEIAFIDEITSGFCVLTGNQLYRNNFQYNIVPE